MQITRRLTGKKPRNRAAQDATLINIRALVRRVAALERQVKALTPPAKSAKTRTRRQPFY